MYFRYADDTFDASQNKIESEEFLIRLNDLHSSLEFLLSFNVFVTDFSSYLMFFKYLLLNIESINSVILVIF